MGLFQSKSETCAAAGITVDVARSAIGFVGQPQS